MTDNYNKLLNNFEKLKLDKIREISPEFIENAAKKEMSLTYLLYDFTEEEVGYRDERASQIQVTVSGFTSEK